MWHHVAGQSDQSGQALDSNGTQSRSLFAAIVQALTGVGAAVGTCKVIVTVTVRVSAHCHAQKASAMLISAMHVHAYINTHT